jgi:hypothetical protein
VLWPLLAPNAGKDVLAKALAGAGCCAGGKLLVGVPPNVLLPPPNMLPLVPFVLLLLLLLLLSPPTAGAGVDAPKAKPVCCGVLKLAPSEAVCMRALACRCASCCFWIARRAAGVLYLDDMLGAEVNAPG